MSQNNLSAKRQSINSLEIAQLVQTRHDSVKRTVKRLAEQHVIQFPPMVEIKNNQLLSPRNQSKAYLFTGEQGKIDSIIVVAQLCPVFTARIVQRWQELEAKIAQIQQAPNHINQAELLALRKEALQKPLWQKIYHYKKLKLKHTEIARLLRLNPSTVRRHVRRMEVCGLLRPAQNLRQQQLALQFVIGAGQ